MESTLDVLISKLDTMADDIKAILNHEE